MDLFHDKKGKSSLKHMCLFYFLSLVPSSSSMAGEKTIPINRKDTICVFPTNMGVKYLFWG